MSVARMVRGLKLCMLRHMSGKEEAANVVLGGQCIRKIKKKSQECRIGRGNKPQMRTDGAWK